MTVGSLFSGIGGFDLAAERAGLTVKWQVEIDPFCRRVLEKHWPAVRRYEDVTECCGGLVRRSHADLRCAECGRRDWLPWVDVICGGFPCQDISEAGKRVGINGERSGLWSQMVRIIGELRPCYALVENVPALANRGLGRVIGDLAEIGMDAEWDVLGAAHLGASQHRERIWILAYPHNARLQGPIWAGQPYPPREAWPAAYSEPLRSACGQWPPGPGAVNDIPRMADGPTNRVDRLRGLGNAIVPQVAEWIFQRIIEAENAQADRAVESET